MKGVNNMKWLNPKTGGWEICDVVLPNETHDNRPIAVRRVSDGPDTLVRCVLTGELTWVPDEWLTDYLGDRGNAGN